MGMVNAQSGTRIDEIGDGIYRINTPVLIDGGQAFSFNQYLVLDDEPLLFHTGPRRMFALVHAAVASVMPPGQLRHVAFSHVEADECGGLNEWLAVAPQAAPLCGRVAAMVSIGDLADRPPRAMADGERLCIGRRSVRWHDAPHLPHGWDCGYLADETSGTLFCGDLFTQPGRGEAALVESDVLGPSEAFRAGMDYFAHAPQTRALLESLAATAPKTLACMHGSAWTGDGGALLRALADAVDAAR
jgi:flavorubredoxin